MRKKNRPSLPEHTDAQNSSIVQMQENTGSGVGEYVKGTVNLTFKYFGAMLLSSIILGLAATVIFSLLDIPVPILWGAIAGIGNAIPVVGQWASIIIIVVLLLLIKPIYALYALVTLLVLQMLDGFLIQPLIVGKTVLIKPLLVAVITLVASALFGWIGLLFAVPIAASLKLAVEIIMRKRNKKAQ